MLSLLAAGFLAAASAGAVPVAVSLASAAHGVSLLEGTFSTSASREKAWQVLTDYDQLPLFVSSMRSSRVRERQGGAVLLEQEAVAGLLFFRKKVRVTLDVREEPPGRLSFSDSTGKTFEVYEGSWELSDGGGGTLVTYKLRAKGGSGAPGFVTRAVSRKAVSGLLAEVRAEMERRAP